MTTFENVDLWDMDAFQRQEHHEMLEQLRETEPGVHFIDEGDHGPGFWAITRLEHLKEVNRQAEIFSSNVGGTQMQERDQTDLSDEFQNASLMLSIVITSAFSPLRFVCEAVQQGTLNFCAMPRSSS